MTSTTVPNPRTSLDLIRHGTNPVLVVRKRHLDHRRFRHEVRWLAAAHQLPVARLELVAPDDTMLATRFVPATTLADHAGSPDRALRLLTDLAEVVAGLAAAGLVHGRLQADHVLAPLAGPHRVLVVSPAACDDVDADLAGLARCCRQAMSEAAAIGLTRAQHPWPEPWRQAWRELAAILDAGSLGPRRAARFMTDLGRHLGSPPGATPGARWSRRPRQRALRRWRRS